MANVSELIAAAVAAAEVKATTVAMIAAEKAAIASKEEK